MGTDSAPEIGLVFQHRGTRFLYFFGTDSVPKTGLGPCPKLTLARARNWCVSAPETSTAFPSQTGRDFQRAMVLSQCLKMTLASLQTLGYVWRPWTKRRSTTGRGPYIKLIPYFIARHASGCCDCGDGTAPKVFRATRCNGTGLAQIQPRGEEQESGDGARRRGCEMATSTR